MQLGLFYQSGFRIEACYHALEQFRKFYPNAPIAFYEDNSNILKSVANKFNCKYFKTKITGRNDPNSGRPAFGIETMNAWLERVYESCCTTLSNTEWVMNFEDDVWFKRPLNGNPPYDLSGIGGIGWDDRLYNYLETNIRGAYGCGGSIFNREKFIKAYHNIKGIDWKFIDDMAKHPKPSEWTDSAITFLFLYSKFTVGPWSELAQYKNSKATHLNDRSNWYGSIDDLEKEQGDVAVIHCWKPFYYPTMQEKICVEKQLINYVDIS